MDNVSVTATLSSFASHRKLIPCRRLVLFLIIFQSLSFVSLWLFWNSGFHHDNVRQGPSGLGIIRGLNGSLGTDGTDRCFPRVPENIDCRLMMMGDVGYMKPMNTSENQTEPVECSLQELLGSCSRFKHAHGYDSFRITEIELSFPLAFALKIHKNAQQVEQILRTIYRPHNVYCIYVDGKAKSDVYETLMKISRCFDNVHVIEDRENIIYASFSHVRAELACMKRCIQSSIQWKYYMNMAGEEYPLRTNKEMVHILRRMGGTNDIESYSPKGVENRYLLRHMVRNGSLKKTSEKKPPFQYNVEMRRGSAYGLFSRDFVRFILEDDIAISLINWFNETLSPEEIVWSTLNALPFAPGGYRTETRHNADTFLARAMVWAWDKTKCQGQFIRSVCNFGPGDFPWIAISPKFILNKINWEKNRLLVQCLEQNYKNRSQISELHTLNWYHYLNLPHVRYYSGLKKDERSPAALSAIKIKWLERADRIKIKPTQ